MPRSAARPARAQADLVVVAPATADLLARAAHGLADDLLTNTLLTARCPVLFVPAMHTEMWEHPATVDNVATLRRRGSVVIEPATGRLTGADTARAGCPSRPRSRRSAELLLHRAGALPADLAGRQVVVTAGGTREPLDPVRFLGNASSGTAGLRDRAGRGGAGRAARHARRRQRRPARPGRRRGRARGHDGRVARRRAQGRGRRRRGRDGRGHRRLPAGAERARQDQEVGARSRADRAEHRIRTFSPSWSPPGGPGRCWSGSPPRPATTGECSRTAGRSWPARAATCSSSTRSAPGKAFGRPDNAAVILGADGTETLVERGPKAVLAAAVWDAVAARLPRPC